MTALSLVIPCYNEARNLPALMGRIRATITRSDVEVILVDNGSTDDSGTVLASALRPGEALRSVRVDVNQGYGFGILAGLAAAKGAILAWTHADMQTDPADCLKGLAIFEGARDPSRVFVKGRRYGRPIADVVFTVGMSIFETVLLRKALWDINAQPTMFPRRLYEGWKRPPHDFSLDLYAYYTAKAGKYDVRRFPVRFGARLHGTSHWNVNWKAKRKFIARTLDYSFRLRREHI